MTTARQHRLEMNRALLLWMQTAIKAQAAGVDIRPWLPAASASVRQVENLAEGLRQEYQGKETYVTGQD